MVRPPALWVSLRVALSMPQPASRNNFDASRRLARMRPDPSVAGGSYALVKTSSGNRPRKGARIACSPGPGSPVAASSELSK